MNKMKVGTKMAKTRRWFSRRKVLKSWVVLSMIIAAMAISLFHAFVGLGGREMDESIVIVKHLQDFGLGYSFIGKGELMEDATDDGIFVAHRRARSRRKQRKRNRAGGVVVGMQRKLEQQESLSDYVGGDAAEHRQGYDTQTGLGNSGDKMGAKNAAVLPIRTEEEDDEYGYPGYYDDPFERRKLEERTEQKMERVRKRKKQFGNVVRSYGNHIEQAETESKQQRGFEMKFQVDDEPPGANGKPVHLAPELEAEADELFKINSFNLIASDIIGLNRSLPDVRPKQCLFKQYSQSLPKTSVIIVFHNEAWSALMRTVHSVINRTPRRHLTEIILVDDASVHEHLGHQLDSYIAKLPVPVTVERMGVRSGLIRARMRGALAAKGQVLTFLDSHCEVTLGWIEPLLARIAVNRRNVVTPVIDVINAQNLAYEADNLTPAIGVFDWSLTFRWQSIQKRDLPRLKRDPTHPVPSPTMAGGLFAIDRRYFIETGMYDPGFEIWGAENLELSFKTWMCGGKIEILPCSHVGHIFRKHAPYPNTPADFIAHNNKRLAEVWLDEYKEFFYHMSPGTLEMHAGNYSDRVNLRRRLKCRSFRWYLENVFPEGAWPGRNKIYGEVRHTARGLCLDTGGRTSPDNEPVIPRPCNNQTNNQIWMYTEDQEIKHGSLCLDYDVETSTLTMMGCHQMEGNQLWDYAIETGEIKNGARDCLDLVVESDNDVRLIVRECDGSPRQRSWQLNMKEWEFKRHDRP